MPAFTDQLNTRLESEGVDADVYLIHDAEPSTRSNINNIEGSIGAMLATSTSSGCVKTVTPPSVFSWTTTPREKRNARHTLYATNGTPLKNLGGQLATAESGKGAIVSLDFDVAEKLTKQVLSLYVTTTKKSRVLYGGPDSYIVHKPAEQTIPLRLESKRFYLDRWVITSKANWSAFCRARSIGSGSWDTVKPPEAMSVDRPGDSTVANTASNDQTSSVDSSGCRVEQQPSDQEIDHDDTDDGGHADHGAVSVNMMASPTAPSTREARA